MKQTLILIIMLLLIPLAFAQDIKINGASNVNSGVQQNALEDAKLFLDARGVELAKTSNTIWNWIVNTAKLLKPPFMQNGIPYASLTDSEKAYLKAHGSLAFDPTKDSRYVTLEQDIALMKGTTTTIAKDNGLYCELQTDGTCTGSFTNKLGSTTTTTKSPYVAIIAELDHTWVDSTGKTQTSRDPTIPSSVPANSNVIPIVYNDKNTGKTSTVYSIAGRTEMDFRPESLGGANWTLKEYVPNGKTFSYLYDRAGDIAKFVETFTPREGIAPSTPTDEGTQTATQTNENVADEIAQSEESAAKDDEAPPADNTIFWVAGIAGVLIVSIIGMVLAFGKKKRR